MLVQVLSAIHNITIMLFGIFCSAFFLGVKPRRKKYPGFISAVLRTGIVIYY